MFSSRRLSDRLTDCWPTTRPHRTRWCSPWRLIALLIAVMTLIALVIGWWQATSLTHGRVVMISTSVTGEHRLDGQPLSLPALEAEPVRLKEGETPLSVPISGSSLDEPPAQPSPEVAALLARLRLNWMSAPQVGLAASPLPPAQGGDHGR